MTTSSTTTPSTSVDSSRPSRRALTLFCLVGLVAFLLSHLALIRRFPWFVDENFFAVIAQAALGDPTQRFGALVDHKGLINSWIAASLIRTGLTPMDAMRTISMLSTVVTAGATGALLARWRGGWAGAIGFVVALFTPYLFVHGAVGVHDPFVAAGSMVSLALGIELARRPRLDLALILGGTWGLLLLSKPTGALALALAPASLLVFDFRAPKLARRLGTWLILLALAGMIAVALWSLNRLSPLAYTPAPDNHRTLSEFMRDPFANLAVVAGPASSAVFGYLTIPGVLLVLAGAIRTVRERDGVGVVLILWVLAALAAMLLLTDSAFPRYGLQLAGPAVALMIYGGEPLARRALNGSRIAQLAITIAILPGLIFDVLVVATPTHAPYAGLDRQQYVDSNANRDPVRHAAQRILSLADRSPEAPTTVVGNGTWPWAATLVLNGRTWTATPRFQYSFAPELDPAAVRNAQYTMWEGPLPEWLPATGARISGRWDRRNGGPTTWLLVRDQPSETSP